MKNITNGRSSGPFLKIAVIYMDNVVPIASVIITRLTNLNAIVYLGTNPSHQEIGT